MPKAPPSDWLLALRREIGANIRAAREYRNLTQEQLGEKAGVDRQAVGHIEAGQVSPYLDTLLRIAHALGVPLADLVR